MVTPYIAAAVAATALFGLAAVALKQGVSRGLPSLTLGEVLRHPLRVTGALLGNKVWIGGLALNLLGGLFYCVALAQLDLTIVKPVVTFYVVVAAVMGAVLLKERIGRLEVAGITVAVVGAAMLGLQGDAMTGEDVAVAAQYRGVFSVAAICVAIAAFTATPLWMPGLRGRVSREVTLSAVAGVLWGLGTAWYKLFFNELLEFTSVVEAGGFVAALSEPAFYGDVVASPALWLTALFNVIGFGIYQLAFASGRVAIVTPIVMAMTLIAPLIAGVGVFGEDLPPLKLAGILTTAAGTVILTRGKAMETEAGP